MRKKKTIEIMRNTKIQKNEYFVENYDVTESVEYLLAEVERDYELKKQVELQCGMSACNDILNKQAEKYKKQIADLEAKLAEKDKAIENWQTMYESVVQTCHNDKEEIERLREINLEVPIKQLQFHHNQDKISFAVEQLEKVKEFLAKRKDDYLYLKDEIKAISHNQYVDFVNEVEIFELKVDNQIKQLKEGK